MALSPPVFEKELKRKIEGDVRFDRGTLVAYSTDASNYRRIPLGVVAPRHEGDILRVVELARENRVPILARGGGTSLGGQTCNAAIVLDFSKYMTAIGAIDEAERTVVVEPGVIPALLNRDLASRGLFFAPDPTTVDRCTIGGMIGNNACGAHSAAYGKTVDNLRSLEFLLADGSRLTAGAAIGDNLHAALTGGNRAAEIVGRLADLRDRTAELVRSRYPRIPRRVSGYNLDCLLPENGFHVARALTGAEGTLGIVIKATLELQLKPAVVALVVMGFADIFTAADQVPWILEHRPEALEAFDNNIADFSRAKRLAGASLLPEGGAFLMAEIGGRTTDEVLERAMRLSAQAQRILGCACVVLTDARERTAVWALRASGLGASAFFAGRPRTWPGAEDTAVAPARLGEYLRRLVPLFARRGLAAAAYYGHFGEGCVHCRVNFDFLTPRGIANFRATMFDLVDLVTEFGGSISGEHGDGIARSELLPKMFGAELIEAFGDFKRIFDPDNLMNPGVIVEPEPLDSHLRITRFANTRPVTTHFDFRDEGGLAGAAMKCVGIGKCRKLDAGTMCPSYMATRDEIHSTRGRSRLLFEALVGDTLPGGLADPALGAALDLCLSCKACKTECPTGIDMAAYKAEYLANYYRTAYRPISSHFFGRIPDIARFASRVPPLARLLTSGVPQSIARRLLGIHPERTLPVFAPRTFRSFIRGRAAASFGGPEVVLFVDTFTNHFEPGIALAALRLFERAGLRVIVPDQPICCGRPLYDQGMLPRARRVLGRARDVLAPFARRGVPIIGLEPSCILTFRDELPSLFPDDPDSALLARHTKTFAEFVASRSDFPGPRELDADVLIQGHCHHKALAGLDNDLAVLARISKLRITAPDSGCCGMAGAFGYDRNHYEVSRTIGERVLFPAVRSSPPGTILVADGFACRSQIRQFFPEARPIHLVQLLER
jgi:FAD/FMN-containing dehydrogenase/Fe-S oxidoreductase